MKKAIEVPVLWVFFFLFIGCVPTRVVKVVFAPEEFKLTGSNNALKIHLKDGGLYVLEPWSTSPSGDTIIGYGKLYSYRRNVIKQTIDLGSSYKYSTPFRVPKNNISLIEISKLKGHTGNLTAISLVGVPMGIMSIYCLANPKACFGSCPTFYAKKKNEWTLMAEGFSSSISSVYEKMDIDRLNGADDQDSVFWLKLTNEALETHIIRYVDLLIFPKNSGENIYATSNGDFFRTNHPQKPTSCEVKEEDFLEKVSEMDRVERFSAASPHDLAQKEEFIVKFANDGGHNKGLIIGARQTLLTTYLFYQVIAYAGTQYGTFVARMENGDEYLKKRIQKLWDKLGGIEISEKIGNTWIRLDTIQEMGPIAADVHLVKLVPTKEKEVTIKIRQTQGLWRTDQLAMVTLLGREVPVRLKPRLVMKEENPEADILQKLITQSEPLVTYPGDRYELQYKLPDKCGYEFFLETKGYYLEWMRENWIQEENLKKIGVALLFPGAFMRKEASGYKKVEPEMEKIFWESRYVNQ
jgi:hypothetical protein